MKGLAAPQTQVGKITMPAGEDNTIGSSITEETATEQEQKMYEALVEPMLGIIHGEQSSKKIEDRLRSGASIGELTFDIASAVVSQIESEGKTVPLEVLQEAAEDVVEDLVEISVAMKLIPDDQDAIEQAYVEGLMEAVEMYGIQQRKVGKLSPEENQKHFDAAVKLGGFDKTKMAEAVKQGIANGQ